MTDNEHEGMKKCSKCGEIKPATAEFFNRDRTKKNGLRGYCKECAAKYYQKNKEEIAERYREYEQSPVGRLSKSIKCLREKTGATIYLRDMTEEQKETLANQYVAVKTLEKTEKELLAASGKKRCSKCGGVFDFDMFHKHRAVCKSCAAKYYEKNKDKINEYNRERYQQKKQKALDKTKSIPDNGV